MPQATTAVKQAKKEIVGRELESRTLIYTIPEGLLPAGCSRVAVFAGDDLSTRIPRTKFKKVNSLCDRLFKSTNQIDYVRVTRTTQKRSNIEIQLKAGMKGSNAVRDKIHKALEKLGDFTVTFKP